MPTDESVKRKRKIKANSLKGTPRRIMDRGIIQMPIMARRRMAPAPHRRRMAGGLLLPKRTIITIININGSVTEKITN